MKIDDFKQEVANNRPRLALFYLVPIIEQLVEANETLTKELATLKGSGIEVSEEAQVEDAPVKKPATKRTAAKATKEASEASTSVE